MYHALVRIFDQKQFEPKQYDFNDIRNSGTIDSGGAGIVVSDFNTVTNEAGGLILAPNSTGIIAGDDNRIVNDGAIRGSSPTGVDGILVGGGNEIVNSATGSISTAVNRKMDDRGQPNKLTNRSKPKYSTPDNKIAMKLT